MARPTAPPGPPPPHYRPPGTPPPAPELPSTLRPQAPAPAPSGVGPGAVTAVAVVTLLVGLVAGFFLGRAYDDEPSSATAPLTTAPAPRPSTPPRTGDTIPQDPPSAPPSTDLAPEAIGTFESPVPVGQAYVLGLYEIEVRAVDRDATDVLQAHDAGNPAAPEGRRHVLVQVAVRFTDPAGLGNPAAIPFFLSDGTAEWSAFDDRCGVVPDALMEAGLLEQGDEAVGNLCFTVPADVVDDVALGTESFSGPLYFALP